jgi:hypothetical protein
LSFILKYYSSIPEIENISTVWSDLQEKEDCSRLENSYDYFLFLAKSNLLGGTPLVIILLNNNNPVLLCAGVITQNSYIPSLGFFKLPLINFRKNCYHIFPYAIYGAPDSCLIKKFLSMLPDALKVYNIDYAFFSALQSKTILADYLLKKNPSFVNDPLPLLDKHYYMKVPRCLNEYLGTKDSRRRRRLKKVIEIVESEFSWEIKMFRDKTEIDQFFNDAETIAVKSYPRAINQGFFPTCEEREKRLWLASKGMFLSYILYLDDLPAAFIHGTLYKKRFCTEDIGFNVDYEKYSLGTYLRLKVIDNLAETGLANILDYGYGSDEYKRLFSTTNNDEARIKMYLPGLSNYTFITIQLLFSKLNRIFRRVLEMMGLYSRIKSLHLSSKRKRYFNTIKDNSSAS